MRLRGTRAANPGAPDMPKPKRSTEVVQAEKLAKQSEKEEKEASRQAAIQKVAELENEMAEKEEQMNLFSDHPPFTQKTKIIRTPVAAVSEGESGIDTGW
jgi:hypothetical protein